MTLALVVTQAGHARFVAAQVEEDIDLSISSVGLTDADFVSAPTLTALPGQFRIIDTISGESVGDSVVHMIIRDAEPVGYRVRGFGLYLADGTLFATYGQATPIFEKSPLTTMHLAIDIAFPTGDIDLLTFGDTNFLQPPATTETKGVAELATQAEVDAGTDATRIVVPSTLAARFAALLGTVNDAIAAAVTSLTAAIAERVPMTRRIDTDGLALGGGALATDRTISVPIATVAQLRAASAGNVAVTPAGLGGLDRLFAGSGHFEFPGGLIVQWVNHRGLISAEPSPVIAFPRAFPTECLAALPVAYISAPGPGRDVTVQLAGEPTVNGCRLQFQSAPETPNGTLDGYTVIAIGR